MKRTITVFIMLAAFMLAPDAHAQGIAGSPVPGAPGMYGVLVKGNTQDKPEGCNEANAVFLVFFLCIFLAIIGVGVWEHYNRKRIFKEENEKKIRDYYKNHPEVKRCLE